MNGGKIPNNITAGDGGGVSVWAGGSFIMNGGEISGNRAGNNRYGGVYVYTSAVFTMNGGTIYGSAANLPAGIDASLANNLASGTGSASVYGTVQFGTFGGHIGSTAITAGNTILVNSAETITAP
ncbi:MAG: hypothetical protein MdMp014T_2756 [Treponematales bacterium]